MNVKAILHDGRIMATHNIDDGEVFAVAINTQNGGYTKTVNQGTMITYNTNHEPILMANVKEL